MTKPGGAPLLFYVNSSVAGHPPYQVHLGANHGTGMCECANFEFEHAWNAAHTPVPSDKNRCKHILEARAYFLDELIRRISQTQ